MRDHFIMFARYNDWANRRLYATASKMLADDYRADRGAFFRSVHGTLNHLLTTDRIWMKRFTGQGDAPASLDAIVHDNFDDLRSARGREDARILAWTQSLDEAALNGVFRFTRASSPEL